MLKLPEWFVFFAKQLSRSKGVFMLVALLTVIAAVCGAAGPLLIGRLIDGIVLHSGEGIARISVLLLGVLLLSELSTTLRAYLSARTMVRLSYSLTEDTLAAILRTSSRFISNTSRGEMLQRCIQDTKVVQKFGLSTLPEFAGQLLLAGSAIAVIAQWNWLLAAVLLAAYMILFIPIHVYGRKRGLARKRLAAHDARLRQHVLEKLDTVKQIKLFGTERKEYEELAAEQDKWADLKFQEGIVESMYRTFPRIPDSLAPALVFLFAGWQMISGQASVGQLVTILAYIPAINAPVRSFFELYVSFADIKVRIHGIMEYLRLPVEPGKKAGLLRLPDYRGRTISFTNVHIAGERGEILRNLSFTIAPGEHVAIVGPSGAGKSTLLKLLLRLQEPSAGDIRIGGISIKELDAAHLRSRVGYVMQENVWFRDSLYNNLTYLAEADRESLDMWMNAFGADDVVTMLPSGYDSDIGAGGDRLSGGQRQLIGLVRTMVKQPDLLLLDEATSSLDQITESGVYEAIDKHAAGITRINVTHRLRGAAMADRILVLNQGELVEEGTHEQLLRRRGLYAELWQLESDQSILNSEHSAREGGSRHERQYASTVQ